MYVYTFVYDSNKINIIIIMHKNILVGYIFGYGNTKYDNHLIRDM